MRRAWILGLAIVLGTGLMVLAFANGNDDGPPRGGMMGGGMMGPGMMGGGMMGPGMMGPGMGHGMMGHGMMGPGMGMGWRNADLSDEQRRKLRDLHYATMQAMMGQMPAMHAAMDDLREATRAFPLNQERVMEAWRSLNSAREQMMRTHLNALAQAQEIVGQEQWEAMQSTRGHGRRGMGGGMMRDR